MHPMLNIAIRAVRKAGTIIIRHYEITGYHETHETNYQTLSNNMKKDVLCQMTTLILKSYPQHLILTEDTIKKEENQNTQWLINPLDSTINYSKKLPHFSISVTVRVKGRSEIAVIYDPMRNELFYASRGQGAQLNGYRLRGSFTREINKAIITTNFPCINNPNHKTYFQIVNRIWAQCPNVRRSGSPSLDLAYIAAGRIDAYCEIGLKTLDFAAGELLIREAGGLVTDFNGAHDYFYSGNLIAGNARIVKTILMNSKKDKTMIKD
ncbi:inositol monophosphatase family protein [Candidatus Erwinia haradaeae]|uniref:Inositol-1-monophosphatase n=1 Tax=Candidatus Erwinia haradaeae TaxID=1922217 RepID=A0A803FUD3_9GAMM|nr:inositol monophosphatase family protein [Candidatus Erwinia haradaeae]VFP88676.1 Inositol-1-monophosphatase [Candidatus Erwinia haradaeae]